MGEFVRLETVGAVGVIRLDRPPVNAINRQIHSELLDVAAQVQVTPDIRSVVLYGGERAFAAGADIKEMADLDPIGMAAYGGALTAAIDSVARLRVPVIAAIVGYALGGGCELALAADFRIIADDARIGLPEITLGVIPGAGGTQRLPRLIGATKAKEMIFLGRPLKGGEAVQIGLASRSVPAGEVYAVALEMATRLAAGPTVALAAAKSAVDNGLDVDLATGLRIEAEKFAGLFSSIDQKAGMTSFIAEGPGKAGFVGR